MAAIMDFPLPVWWKIIIGSSIGIFAHISNERLKNRISSTKANAFKDREK